MKSTSILLINPHLQFQDEFGGRSSLPRSREYLLNIGLLSIASYLQRKQFPVKILDLSMVPNPQLVLADALREFDPTVVGISNQSCYSYIATQEYANITRSMMPGCKIVVGGLHAGGLAKTLIDECPSIDIVVVGEGEIPMHDIVTGLYHSPCTITPYGMHLIISDAGVLPMDDVPPLCCWLYPNYKKFVPYVEESRGCTSKCIYCTSPSIHKTIRVKSPHNIVYDVMALRHIYGWCESQENRTDMFNAIWT